MNIKLDKNAFVESVLTPASKLSENVCLDFANNTLKTFVSSNDNSVILLSIIDCFHDTEFKVIIPDTKTFIRLFSSIEDKEIILTVDQNTVYYKSPIFSFKYHLLDENYISSKRSISEDKLNQLQFDTNFTISKNKISEILKFNSIIPDAEKLYFSTDSSNRIFAKLGDEQKCNTNEVNIELCENYSGKSINSSIPLSVQNLLLMSFNDEKINIFVNHDLKIFKFETTYTKYIVSGLVK